MEQIVNSHGERYIPEKIKRKVRKEAAFGCVVCGVPVIEYHHIVLWSKENKHEVENLVALCPSCHQKVHNNLISSEQLKSFKKLPFNKNVLIVKDKLYLHDIKNLTFYIGGSAFNNVLNLIKLSGKDVIFFKEENNQTTLNALFYNKEGILEAEIKDNEWIVYIADNTWDIKYSGGTLSVRNNNKNISLNLDIDMEKNYIRVTGEIYYHNNQLIMNKDTLVIKNLISNSQMILRDTKFINSDCAISFE